MIGILNVGSLQKQRRQEESTMEPSLLGSGSLGVPGCVGLGPTGLNMTAVNADTSSRQSADVKKHVSLQSTAKGAL